MFNSVADPEPHVFGIPDPVSLVRVMDPDPDLESDPGFYIIMQN